MHLTQHSHLQNIHISTTFAFTQHSHLSMTAEHLDIEPFELIGNQRITLQAFQSIFNEQDEDFPLIIDEEFPLVISREIYSFIQQPTSEQIGQIRHMVYMQIETMQQSVEQSVERSVEQSMEQYIQLQSTSALFNTYRSTGALFDWAQYDRMLQQSNQRSKIAEIILTFVPKCDAFYSTREHTMALMYQRQDASEAFQRQEFELQLTIDQHDPCVSVYMPPWRVPTPPALKKHRQALMDTRQAESEAFQRQEAALQSTVDEHDPCVSVHIPHSRIPIPQALSPSQHSSQAFQSPPRKKRKKMEWKSEAETEKKWYAFEKTIDIFENSFHSGTNCWTEAHPDTQHQEWCEAIHDNDYDCFYEN